MGAPTSLEGVELAGPVDEAGTVVPLVELPDGALPVSAAWLSGVVAAGVEALSGGGGKLPASLISEPGLGLLSSVRGGDGARGAPTDSGAFVSAGGGASGCLVSSAITSRTYTLTSSSRSIQASAGQSAELWL